MTRAGRALLVEVLLYAGAVWLSVELAKTDEERLADQVRRYWHMTRFCWACARGLGGLAMELELHYWKALNNR